MLSLFIQCLLIILAYVSGWFLFAVYKQRNDVADIAWGLGYIVVCFFLLLTRVPSPVLWLLSGLITTWGLRLSIHIYLRNKNKTEDFRYKAWREQWGRWFYWRSYLQVFVLQGLLLLIIISPVVHTAATAASYRWNIFSWVGIIGWVAGFYFQSVADHQLLVFSKQRKNKAEILETGLWKYSRHPNYFGEMLMWWGIFIITLPLKNSIWFVIGPLTITLLLRYVSGVPMLEKKFKGNTDYEAYKKSTNALVPWRKRKF